MPFTFANAFNRFFTLLGSNFAPFAIIGLFGTILPTMALTWEQLTYLGLTPGQNIWVEKVNTFTPQMWAYYLGAALIVGIIHLMSQSAVVEVSILRSVDKRVNYGSVLGHAILNVIPLFVIGFTASLLVILGVVLLVVPGIIWALCTCVAIPIYIGQRQFGAFGSISQSFTLTRNHRWQIFLLFLVMFLAAFFVGGGLGFSLLALPGGVLGLPSLLARGFINGLSTLIGQVFVASLYVSLRESKETLSPDLTARVFD